MAFAEFLSTPEATKAMKAKNGTELDGSKIEISYKRNKIRLQEGPGEPSSTLFVANVRSRKLTLLNMRILFKSAIDCQIPTDNKNRNHRGLVEYKMEFDFSFNEC